MNFSKRKRLIVLTVAAIAIPVAAQSRMTIAQFEQLLGSGFSRQEDDLVTRLSTIELTERARSERLARWQSQFKSMRGRQVLLAMADASVVLDLPADDIPADAGPDKAAQSHILAAAAGYIENLRPRLPNFSAVRTTTRFEIATRVQMKMEEDSLQTMQMSRAKLGYRRLGPAPEPDTELFFVATTEALITYRDGAESASPQLLGRKRAHLDPQGFVSAGEFGPILSIVDKDAFRGRLGWHHWERGADGTLAVFHYSVPQTDSHFAIYTGRDVIAGLPPTASHPGYHGEIAIRPADGAIYRIVIVADPDPKDPALASAVTVEYGPVDIGGKNYVCPIHAVALSTVRDQVDSGSPLNSGQLRHYINDITFSRYHIFRSESRILP